MKRAGLSRPLLLFLPAFCAGSLSLGPLCAAQAKAAQSRDKDRVSITAAKLDYYDKQQKLIYSGNVVAVHDDATLKTPLLIIYLAPKPAGTRPGPPSSTSEMRRMEAAGPVTLISKDQIATGDSGIYEKADNKVYINGNVSLTQGPNVTKGDHIVYDLNTHQAVVTGHVRSMFLPNNESAEGGSKRPGKVARAAKTEPSE